MKLCTIFLFPLSLVLLSSATMCAQWEQTSGPTGGRILAYAASGDDVYIAVPEAGIFRSSDRGQSWTLTNTHLLGKKINALAADDNHVYASTADRLIHSTDAGETWTDVDTSSIGKNATVMLVSGTEVYLRTNAGAFYSTDDGTSWQPLASDSFPASDISCFYKDRNVLLVGTKTGSICRTDDFGSSWTLWSDASLAGATVKSFTVYEATLFANVGPILMTSADDGVSWKAVIASPNVDVVVTSQSNLLVVSGGGIRKSTDVGNTWLKQDPFWDGKSIEYVVATGNILYARSYAGLIYASSDAGATWNTSNAGFVNTRIGALAAIGSSTVYAGTAEHGLWRTSNAGDSWTRIDSGFALGGFRTLWFKGSVMFASKEHGIYKSSDSGRSWSGDMTAAEPNFGGTFKSFASIDGVSYAASGTGVWRMTDGGTTWSPINPENMSIGNNALTTIGSILIASGREGLHRSTDGGVTWEQRAQGGFYAFAKIGAVIFAGTDNGVVRSDDSGMSWTPAHMGLPSRAVTTLLSAGPNLFAVTNGLGVFLSTNSGDLWTEYNEGLPTTLSGRNIEALATSGEYLFSGPFRTGAWRRSIADIAGAVGVEEEPAISILTNIQCSPNPLSEATTITCLLVHPSFVTVTVVNIRGECEATVLSEPRDAGPINVRWNPNGLSSGLYYVQLNAGGRTETQAIVLQR